VNGGQPLGFGAGIEAELTYHFLEALLLVGVEGIEAGEDPAFPLWVSQADDNRDGQFRGLSGLLEALAALGLPVVVADEEHTVQFPGAAFEEKQGPPRCVGIGGAGLAVEVPMCPDVGRLRQFGAGTSRQSRWDEWSSIPRQVR
jgi:hypothetical protein